MNWKNKETYEKRIATTFFSLAEEMAEEEIKILKLENQKLREQLLLHNVSQQRELLIAFDNMREFDIKHDDIEESVDYFLKNKESYL